MDLETLEVLVHKREVMVLAVVAVQELLVRILLIILVASVQAQAELVNCGI
jgi:hypothetical protein